MTRLRKKLENLAIAIKIRNINDVRKYAKNTILILAGVTISTLTGNSGISSNANQARIQNELAQYKEQMKLYLAEKRSKIMIFLLKV